MQPSRKQKIYIEIMEMVLPHLRNLETHNVSQRTSSGNYYAELELVHNLPRRLVDPEFTMHDAHWVASQGRIYITKGRRDSGFYEPICRLIREVDGMEPLEMRKELDAPPLPKENGK